jgi:hypothetical protein
MLMVICERACIKVTFCKNIDKIQGRLYTWRGKIERVP